MQNFGGREWILGLVLSFLVVAGLAEGQPEVLLLLAIMAGIYFSRQNRNQQERRDERRDRRSDRYYRDDPQTAYDLPPRTEERPGTQVYKHALEAVRTTGNNPDDMQVLPVDLGLLVFHGNEEPVIHRLQPVEDDADYIQPYVQLRVPVAARGKVRFELLNEHGRRMYVHEDNYELKRGRNLLIPNTRLPIHDEQITNGRWRLRIMADSLVLADHYFSWKETSTADIQQHVAADGEISNEMRAMLAENRLGQMSLDELLSHQEEEDQDAQRRR
ncbi:MAG: hypothetical protein SF029_26170 [bacterium]|nr:hypothetical protein [bacterium]